MSDTKEYRITSKKIRLHFNTICRHKYWVMYYCHKCGITKRGLLHDLSKFSPTEFWTNVKYVVPGKSPIDVQKEKIGFSMAWQHHKGHNPHHYEFWMDKFDDGCYVTRMPFKYAVEMLCDNLAAGKAYQGDKFSYTSEWNWWQKQREIRNMHPDNRDFLDIAFYALYKSEYYPGSYVSISPERSINGKYTRCIKAFEDSILNYDTLEEIYENIVERSELPKQVKIRQPIDKKEENV